jgi:hypothetical protein
MLVSITPGASMSNRARRAPASPVADIISQAGMDALGREKLARNRVNQIGGSISRNLFASAVRTGFERLPERAESPRLAPNGRFCHAQRVSAALPENTGRKRGKHPGNACEGNIYHFVDRRISGKPAKCGRNWSYFEMAHNGTLFGDSAIVKVVMCFYAS